MSIRLWLVSSCLVLLVLGFGGIFLAAYFLQSTVFALFPAATAPEVSQVVRSLLIGQAVALVVFIGLLLIVLFAVLGRIIGRPLRGILRTVNAFTASGERVPLPPLSGSPKEIRELAVAFTGFFERTEEAHAHDVEVSRVKSDFISTAAHQLRTPLTGIRWALEALEQEPLTEGQKALVKSATDKSHELVAIVGTLLDISSIESGKYKYAFAPVDMQGLAGEVAADFGPLASASKVSLFFEKHEGTLPSVRGRPRAGEVDTQQPHRECHTLHAGRRHGAHHGGRERPAGELARAGYGHRHRAHGPR